MPIKALPGFQPGKEGIVNWTPDTAKADEIAFLHNHWGGMPQSIQLPNFNVDMSLGGDLTAPKGSLGSYQGITGGTHPRYRRQAESTLNEQGSNIAMSVVNFADAAMNSYSRVKDQNELYVDAGQSTGYGAGYNYLKQNDIDRHAELQDLKAENTSNTLKTTAAGAGLGASVGSVIPGLGTLAGGAIGAGVGLVTGLFGSSHRKRKLKRAIYNAQQDIIRQNTWSNADAQTDYLEQAYYNEYGSTQDDTLYSAATGKDPEIPTIGPYTMRSRVREFNRKLTLPKYKSSHEK